MKRLIISGLFLIAIASFTVTAAKLKGNNGHLQDTASDTIVRQPFFRIAPFRLNILSPSSGVQFYREGIVFLSNTKTEARVVPDHVSFGKTEAYYAKLVDTVLVDRAIFPSSQSFTFPADAMTFNQDYTEMYFSRLPDNKNPEKIYYAQFKPGKNEKGEWKIDNHPLSFCNDASTYTHPALSADGNMIIFSSNKKGSEGRFDLFITRKEGINWSVPENLGNPINTSGNELFPFLDSENNLFFSSDGHKGFGGYDLFICRYNGKGWDNPANLSQHVNTANDELAFTLNRTDGKSAFFTSRQLSWKQPMQLLRITFENPYALRQITELSKALAYIAFPYEPAEEKTAAIYLQKTEPQAENMIKEPDTKEIKSVEIPEKTQPEPEKKIIAEPVRQPAKVETKTETLKATVPESDSVKDVVVYRVQFVANSKPKGSYQITINGVVYNTYEYLYNGMYRSCAGEFNNLRQAINLQNLMRKEGHSEAFVVAFKNNERSLDPALFR